MVEKFSKTVIISRELLLSALFLFVLVQTSLLITSCKNLKAEKPSPSLVITPDSISMGELEEGEEYNSKVKLTNKGSKKLKIYEAHSSCGCTVPDLKKRDLLPDESTNMDILIDTVKR